MCKVYLIKDSNLPLRNIFILFHEKKPQKKVIFSLLNVFIAYLLCVGPSSGSKVISWAV